MMTMAVMIMIMIIKAVYKLVFCLDVEKLNGDADKR